jgi:chromosome segregation ATPase
MTDTQDRVLAERRHWTGVVSMCRDKYECLLIKKDVEIAQSTASKDDMIYKLRQELQSSTQSLKNQDEDIECLMFAHRQTQIDLRKSLGNLIESKKDIITKLRAKIVDQGEMCYEMLDEVNEHKRSAQLMKKHANEATKLSISRKRKNEAANVSVQCLQDQVALMQDEITTLRKTCNNSKCRIMDLEEENMDLMDTIHVSIELAVSSCVVKA